MPHAEIGPEFLAALAAMAAATFACRAGGFFLMRFVTVTPRLEAALRAIPIGVMIGIVLPVAATGRIPELIGLAHGAPKNVAQAYAKVSALEIQLANRRLAIELRHAGVRVVNAAADRLALETLEAYLAQFGVR